MALTLIVPVTHLVDFLINAVGVLAVLAVIGGLAGLVQWRIKRARSKTSDTREVTPSTLPTSPPPPRSPTPREPPKPVDVSRIRPAERLTRLRERVAAGDFEMTGEARKAMLGRLDDVIAGVSAAHGALLAAGPNALELAAQKLVYCHWVTGTDWRRYIIGLNAFDASLKLANALKDDIAPLASELARLIAGRPGPTPSLVRQDGVAALACDACGRAAVTFHSAPEGMRYSSLSVVSADPVFAGGAAKRLVALIAADDARGILALLTAPEGRGCSQYCPDCDRIYCKDHYSIESKWSGSWHEATDATCPLGHRREFE